MAFDLQKELETIERLKKTASPDEQLAWLLANSFPQEEDGNKSLIFVMEGGELLPYIARMIDAIYFEEIECPDEWKIYEGMIRDTYRPYFLSVELLTDKPVEWGEEFLTAYKEEQPGVKNIPALMSLVCGNVVREEKVFLVEGYTDEYEENDDEE